MNQAYFIKKEDRIAHEEKDGNQRKLVFEYNTFSATDVDIAQSELRGRYPDIGFAANEVSAMIVYVLKGGLTISLESGEEYKMKPEDILYIQPKCWYAMRGEADFLMSCSPAWRAEQAMKKV